MRRNIFVLTLLLVMVAMTTGCRKSSFKIDFALDPDVWGNYQLAWYATDGKTGKWITTTAPLQQGRFSVTGVSRRPAVVYVDNGNQSGFIYAEPGNTISISGNSPDPALWAVSGNEVNEELSAWRKTLKGKAGAGEIASFVKANPGSQAGAMLLLAEYPRREDPEGFVKLWNSLDPASHPEEVMALMPDADFAPGSAIELKSNGKLRYDAPRRQIKSLALRRMGGHADTLRFQEGKKTALLWFYKRGGKLHYETADTLKTLRKSFPDSARHAFATVSLDADSMIWRNAVKFDSIPKVLDAWMPLGVNDTRARLLGVTRLPYFIVIDKEGRQVYRGEDHKEAAKAYRSANR